MKFVSPVFEVKNLFFTANEQKILEDITLTILPGDYCAIIGPNGGGKTTLIRLLLGLEKPTQGRIELFGQQLSRFKRWYKVGYVPQRASQLDQNFPATVLEVVKMGRIAQQGLFSRATQADKEAIEEAMVKMDVLDIQHKLVGELSGGQRQRVMIARALASKPEVLILDEPNTGVDVISQKRFYKLLKELNEEEKMTIIFITHDIGVIADDIGRLFTVNQTLLTCNNPKEAISCDDMSALYGIDAHLIHNHHHH